MKWVLIVLAVVVVLILAQIPDAAGGFGGSVAGPHVRDVISKVLAYWRVTGKPSEERIAAAPTPTPGGAR